MKKIRTQKFLLFILISAALNTNFGMKPEREYKARPSDYGIIYQELIFLTRDNIRVKAWFYPSQDTLGIANELIGRVFPVPPGLKRTPRPYLITGSSKNALIVISMGDAGNMADLIFYAYHFFTRGFHVLTFDWRGFGESSDWPIDNDQLSCTEFLLDYETVLDSIKKLPQVDSTRVGVFGCSTGAYLSFAMAAKRNDIKAYAGRALMTSFSDLLEVITPLSPERHFKAPADYPNDLEPINAASDLKIPVFLIVGEKDKRTPVWMSNAIFEKINVAKELWIVPNAEHGGMNGPEVYNYPEFFIRVSDFFKKYLNT